MGARGAEAASAVSPEAHDPVLPATRVLAVVIVPFLLSAFGIC